MFFQYVRDDVRTYTLNVTLEFIIHPTSETFSVLIVTLSAVKDAGKLVEPVQNCTYLAVIYLAVNSAANWAKFSQ